MGRSIDAVFIFVDDAPFSHWRWECLQPFFDRGWCKKPLKLTLKSGMFRGYVMIWSPPIWPRQVGTELVLVSWYKSFFMCLEAQLRFGSWVRCSQLREVIWDKLSNFGCRICILQSKQIYEVSFTWGKWWLYVSQWFSYCKNGFWELHSWVQTTTGWWYAVVLPWTDPGDNWILGKIISKTKQLMIRCVCWLD